MSSSSHFHQQALSRPSTGSNRLRASRVVLKAKERIPWDPSGHLFLLTIAQTRSGHLSFNLHQGRSGSSTPRHDRFALPYPEVETTKPLYCTPHRRARTESLPFTMATFKAAILVALVLWCLQALTVSATTPDNIFEGKRSIAPSRRHRGAAKSGFDRRLMMGGMMPGMMGGGGGFPGMGGGGGFPGMGGGGGLPGLGAGGGGGGLSNLMGGLGGAGGGDAGSSTAGAGGTSGGPSPGSAPVPASKAAVVPVGGTGAAPPTGGSGTASPAAAGSTTPAPLLVAKRPCC
ncbi:uncharacterized protein PFL1_05186 [Pseudozyma flocculosa PF-1]|uniref:Uncharacterized protein n=1 Tax=Pseudozyma flocculosa PF-1 TaxID=1277687 RepID=A0A061H3V4_9BASI|nr:uncharacterized protein PFL1_05186 [Pseudozyma flocculosa PF-1]EPQ27263.1 hypothetical protein PFL1_05186 [Pseudozyma flocculosa PF-1]